MSKSFLTTTAILNLSYVVVLLLTLIILDSPGNLSPIVIGAISLLYLLGFILCRVFNSIYFYKDGFKFAALMNVLLILVFIGELVQNIFSRSHLMTFEQAGLMRQLLFICNLTFGVLLDISIIKAERKYKSWLLGFAVVNIIAFLIGGIHYIVGGEFQTGVAVKNVFHYSALILTILSLVSLSVHQFKRKKSSLADYDHPDVIDS